MREDGTVYYLAAALADTVARYNELCAAGDDEDFGKRRQCLSSLTEPPFYGVHAGTTLLVTMGGLKINANTEVLNEKGEVIPGLFAAGEVTGGVHGANRLGGNAVADFTVFGRIAGAASSKYAA